MRHAMFDETRRRLNGEEEMRVEEEWLAEKERCLGRGLDSCAAEDMPEEQWHGVGVDAGGGVVGVTEDEE